MSITLRRACRLARLHRDMIAFATGAIVANVGWVAFYQLTGGVL